MTTMGRALVEEGMPDSFAKKPADCEHTGKVKTYGAGRVGTLSMCLDCGQRWQKRDEGRMPVNPKERPSSRNPTGAMLAPARSPTAPSKSSPRASKSRAASSRQARTSTSPHVPEVLIYSATSEPLPAGDMDTRWARGETNSPRVSVVTLSSGADHA